MKRYTVGVEWHVEVAVPIWLSKTILTERTRLCALLFLKVRVVECFANRTKWFCFKEIVDDTACIYLCTTCLPGSSESVKCVTKFNQTYYKIGKSRA